MSSPGNNKVNKNDLTEVEKIDILIYSRLHTIGRKRICADPGRDWVRKAVGKVDEARMIKIEEEEGKERETVTKGPAVPRKHGKGQKKGKGKENGGKRGGKRNGRGRKRTGRLTGNLDVRSKRWTSASRRLSQ